MLKHLLNAKASSLQPTGLAHCGISSALLNQHPRVQNSHSHFTEKCWEQWPHRHTASLKQMGKQDRKSPDYYKKKQNLGS